MLSILDRFLVCQYTVIYTQSCCILHPGRTHAEHCENTRRITHHTLQAIIKNDMRRLEQKGIHDLGDSLSIDISLSGKAVFMALIPQSHSTLDLINVHKHK